MIAAEPRSGGSLTEDEFDAVLEAIGDFTDLKSPFTIGHSRAWRTWRPRRRGVSACRTPRR